MFEFFRRHTRIFQYVLFPLILVSFGIFGIQSYSRLSGDDAQTVARVDGHNISQAELDGVLREQIERARQQSPNVDVKSFDTPEVRHAALDSLVRDRVMLLAADKLHLTMSDERLQRRFATDPQFANIRNADGSVNVDAIAAAGFTSESFAERLRQDLSRRQVILGLAASVAASPGATSTAFDAMFQRREIQVQRFDAKDFASKVAPTDAEIEAYYKDPVHAAQFQAPEQSTVEYVVLDFEALKKGITPTEDQMQKYYADNAARYIAPEERRVSDIMIKADKGAPKTERERARAKAESVLADVRKDPSSFAAVARKRSEDPVAAEKGGDLDFIGRNMTVKAFEDAAFALKPGEISGVIDGDDGFHVIQVTAARGGDKRSFESLRADIENEVRAQLVQARYGQIATDFTNALDDQSDTLKPIAERWKLELKTAKNVSRVPADGATGPLANAKFLDALFTKDAIDKKRNTGAIEIGSNQLAAGRVIDHAAMRQLPLADVKVAIRDRIVAAQSLVLARKAGAERLAAVRKTPDAALADTTIGVSRAQPGDVPRVLLEAALNAPVQKLPAFVGVDLPEQGYAIAKIVKVSGRDPIASDAAQAQTQYARAWADAEAQAYFGALKTRLKVDIKAPATPTDAAAARATGATAPR